MPTERTTYDLSGLRWENVDTCESVLALPIWWELPEVVEFDIWNPILFFRPDPETGIGLPRPPGRTLPDKRHPTGVPFTDVRDAVVRGFASMRFEGVRGAKLTAHLYDPSLRLMEFLKDPTGHEARVSRSWGDCSDTSETYEYYFDSLLAWPNAAISLRIRARTASMTFNVDQLAVPDAADVLPFDYPEELVRKGM